MLTIIVKAIIYPAYYRKTFRRNLKKRLLKDTTDFI